MVRARRILITLFQVMHIDGIKEWALSRPQFRYIVAAKETCPETRREHIHCYMEFKSKITFDPSDHGNPHVDVCRGTSQQNRDYVVKDGNILFEEGQMATPGREHAKLTVKDLMEMKQPDELQPHHLKPWIVARTLNQRVAAHECYKQVEVHYYYGPSGCGKSHSVYDRLLRDGRPFDRVSFENGFWLGISADGCSEVAWYDDFRDSDMKPVEFIRFIDYYVNNLNVKNGMVKNNYKVIFITSVQKPDVIYPNVQGEPRAQWMRRIIPHNVEEEAREEFEDLINGLDL